MTLGAFLLMTSCDKNGNDTDTGDTGDSELNNASGDSKVVVLRAITLIESGTKLEKADFETVEVSSASVPEGAITNMDDAVGKYSSTVLFPGDYVIADKLSDKKQESVEVDEYIVVTDYIKSKKEASKYIQNLIDENPNKTLYFPDGTYFFSTPLKVPTEAGKSVSIRFSNRVVIQPSASWSSGEALICIGSDTEKSNAKGGEDTCTVSGGTIDTNGKVETGVLVKGAGNVLVSNMSVKKANIGIHIKTNNVDVDNVVITGNDSVGCTGVLLEGSYNTLTNMRIYKIHTGIKLTKGNNVLRNLHPLLSPTNVSNDTCGFWDISEGNFYDYCYSDQLATGFRLGDGNASVLNGCFAYWYSNKITRHWGIHATGRFNSVVRSTTIAMNDYEGNASNAYIVVEDAFEAQSQGMVIDPLSEAHNPYGDFISNMVEPEDDLAKFRVQ